MAHWKTRPCVEAQSNVYICVSVPCDMVGVGWSNALISESCVVSQVSCMFLTLVSIDFDNGTV